MSNEFKVACVQNCAADDLAANLAAAEELVRAAAADGAELICLPEMFSLIAPSDRELLEASAPERTPGGEVNPALQRLSALGEELGTWLLLGSIMVRAGHGRMHNRGFVIDPHGQVTARYDKLHLFDVGLSSGETYRESEFVTPGESAVTVTLPWGTLGMSICYDLRFAALYRALAQAGAQFLSVPAAFTRTTGKAHWHTLVRARAIETGCYVFAPNQCGTRPWGRATYGHSLIVDPWGEVLADGGEQPGFVSASIDPARVHEVRSRIPSLGHDRAFATERHGEAALAGTGTGD